MYLRCLCIVFLSISCSQDFKITPWYWNSLMYDLISRERMQCSSSCRSASDHELSHIISIVRSTRYPSLLGRQEQCWMRSLPYTSPHLSYPIWHRSDEQPITGLQVLRSTTVHVPREKTGCLEAELHCRLSKIFTSTIVWHYVNFKGEDDHLYVFHNKCLYFLHNMFIVIGAEPCMYKSYP